MKPLFLSLAAAAALLVATDTASARPHVQFYGGPAHGYYRGHVPRAYYYGYPGYYRPGVSFYYGSPYRYGYPAYRYGYPGYYGYRYGYPGYYYGGYPGYYYGRPGVSFGFTVR
jgi:hypothetical protein